MKRRMLVQVSQKYPLQYAFAHSLAHHATQHSNKVNSIIRTMISSSHIRKSKEVDDATTATINEVRFSINNNVHTYAHTHTQLCLVLATSYLLPAQPYDIRLPLCTNKVTNNNISVTIKKRFPYRGFFLLNSELSPIIAI